ncbi:aspartate/glutamate racemase family protein [Paenalcaligenes sp. Me131]|uniref:aspartate/glutamate racemase family protein n=1 Tax=unclassified Paenalcaligenes TaxID=2685726 RepID=UPI003D2DE16B
MHIRLINPNTTAPMTSKIGEAGKEVASAGTIISATNPADGPVSIESHYDEAIAAVGVLEEIRKGEQEGVDAYIIACFGDPGLLAAREMTRAPVIGIAEAAFHVAAMVSTRFSIVTTLSRTGIIAEHLLEQYGFKEHCRKVRAAEIPVLALEEEGDAAFRLIVEECLRAKAEDGIGAVVLGCGGMADLRHRISEAVQMPVIEGVTAAVKLAEALVGLGVHTSKFGDLNFPLRKKFTGKYAYLSDIDMA